MRTKLASELAVEIRVAPGSPVDHLTHLVDKAQLVLVIMTTRGQDGLQRMLRSGAPMRLIPPAATPAPSSEVT